MHLYQIPGEFRRLMEAEEEFAGLELTGENVDRWAVLQAEISALVGTLEEKARWRVALIREREAEADAIKQEISRLRQLMTWKENAAARYKAELMATLQELGSPKLDVGIAKIGIQKASRPSIRWTRGMDELPAVFVRTKTELDSDKAFDALKANGELPDGFEVKTTTFLSIR